MSLTIPPQWVFLYKGRWTHEIDSLFLSTIIRMREASKWNGFVIPTHFLMEASKVIHAETGLRFNREELYDRLLFLENRFQTFNYVATVPEMYWNVKQNLMQASDEIWLQVLKHDKMAGAYYYNGEPEYKQMCTLFGFKEVKVEKTSTLIIISDTTDNVIGKKGKEPEDEEVQEVDSPNLIPGPKPKRKLFFEEEELMDVESTNNKGKHYYTLGEDGQMKNRRENVHPPRASVPKKNLLASPLGSSCASSSPTSWWRN